MARNKDIEQTSKIVLLGYMGCGKSTVGEALSAKTGTAFIDLDQQIEKKTNLSIANIFRIHGEIYFRKLETEVLTELLSIPQKLIISLGGGTPCYGNNMDLLNRADILSIYLEGSVHTLIKRLSPNKSNRPLIATKTDAELKDYISKHLFERSFYYNQSKLKISVDNMSVEEIVKRLLAVSF